MTTRLIETTVTVRFRTPDAHVAVPTERYRESIQMDMHRWLYGALSGCKVEHLAITLRELPE